ncbi:DUF2306 domain-containing protein [Gilvirhabdus luticola]|nr:DUF2306 domain-containing protein [Yeosuana sp. MJ-SS3]
MALFAIFIGLYPLRFIGLSYNDSLLGNKSSTLLDSLPYIIAFYTHIFLGGLALLSGFSQFFKILRRKYLGIHKVLGKVYIISVLLSGTAGLCIAFFAEGGFIASTGFAALAVLWLFTTVKAYSSIKNKDIARHQQWMVRSYALCFAAVTLRIYMPLFLGVLGMDFIPAYKIIAWLCWVPNLLVAEVFIIRK